MISAKEAYEGRLVNKIVEPDELMPTAMEIASEIAENTSSLVNLTLTVPTAIFAEATLSFLGLGVPAPQASWGTLTSDALGSI